MKANVHRLNNKNDRCVDFSKFGGRLKIRMIVLAVFLATQTYAETEEKPKGFAKLRQGMSPLEAAQLSFLVYENTFSADYNYHNLVGTVPVYEKNKTVMSVFVLGGALDLNDDLVLSSGLKLADHFYRADAGLHFYRELEGEKAISLRGVYGYATDKISSRNDNFGVSASYSFKAKDQAGRWYLLAMMSDNSPLGEMVLLPGFFYMKRTPTFMGIYGLPILVLRWMPPSKWTYGASLFGPLINLEVSRKVTEKSSLFLSANLRQQKYLMNERIKKDDRLTLEEKNIELGFRTPIVSWLVFAEVKAGYSFDRRFYAGQKLFDTKAGSVDLDHDWLVRFNIRTMF